MKINRSGSDKFKQVKKMEFKYKVTKRIAVGAIAISLFLLYGPVKFVDNNFTINNNCNNLEFLQQSNNIEETIGEDPIISNEDKIKEKPLEEIIKENEIITPSNEGETINKQNVKMVALSFDDGPSKTLTIELLQILKSNNATATFFIIGNKVNQYKDIILEIYNAGNEIGNHSYDHSNFTKLSKEQITEQYNKTNELIYQVTNEYPTLFRPPYGAINNKVKEHINSPVILWSIDSNDWRKMSDEEVINNVLSNLEDGKIILMHDIHKRTIEVCQILIPKIKDLGYEIVSIKELFEYKNMELENGVVYTKTKKN